ncbi:glutathione S-transferase C-terminal domain-containing protein [Streptomyces litchfieldiae]|uniref:Glutathione S-transferase C-terminal domain-containing protein n=1 Tax=Streptomyces litchfieldiae TaxID=3075543 RepID=A0ABU2MWG6_9ACTN|nr:glutathione S-transferase C-terminal domain-containing protein [Streptomyces sp. DSM 44938]MDT0345949.1 glutathione S-transferase C-terminal domain-containing protein [Streptomyces sp. DSM 44938]
MSAIHPCAFRSRIGPDANHGFYPAPLRYRLYLSLACPGCLRIAITHRLLGLADRIPLTELPAVPEPDGGYAELRTAYDRTTHGYRGPATAPVLADHWTGRVVSNHAPDILRDLAVRFRTAGTPELRPPAAEKDIAELARLCDHDITEAAQQAGRATAEGPDREAASDTLLTALATLEERLSAGPYVLGDALTAADVDLWVTLVRLDTVHRWHLDAEAVHRIAAHPALWSYAKRLLSAPAFGDSLHIDDITRRHHARCRGLEAAGAAVRIIDWTPDPSAVARCPGATQEASVAS